MRCMALRRSVWIQERIMQDNLQQNMAKVSQELQMHCQKMFGSPSLSWRGYPERKTESILLGNLNTLLERSQADKEYGSALIAEARADYAAGKKDHSCITALDAAQTLAESNAAMRAAILVMQEIMQYVEKDKVRGKNGQKG